MKNSITLITLLITTFLFSQNGINYKAVIKDNLGNVVANQNIEIQFIILEDATNVYQETHLPTTDANGIAIVNIGEGVVISGVFTDIDWGNDDHFLNVQIDTGSGLVDIGTTEFKAVPYALSSGDHPWLKNSNGIYTSNNNVGINSVNPSHTLDVRSSSQADPSGFNLSNSDKSRNLRFFSGSNAFPDPSTTWSPNHSLLFATYNDDTFTFNELMRISSDGNVGIKTVNPTQKLEVEGKIKIGDDSETPSAGTMRFIATTNTFEGFDGTQWIAFSSKQERSFIISRNTDYTIVSGFSNIPMNNVDLDIGNCVIDIGGNKFFRAPVSGRYQINGTINIKSASIIGGVDANLSIVTAGTSNFVERFVFTRTGNSTNETFSFATVLNLDSGEYVRISFGNSGSSTDPIVFGGNIMNAIKLSGFLIK
ncbi:hypothetical protein [Xanthomarina sp. F2636L]|uniref:hypothetical protein n=1 Tax=Xanthomarina sp. F2636L TaxID=2996018 RepID=UPI00225E2F97|nr:hypothetical protein [Xanthomarina sp. F2636L]MCX7550481.1 hypothetical protein [Xanthomarina sp. F2636L]